MAAVSPRRLAQLEQPPDSLRRDDDHSTPEYGIIFPCRDSSCKKTFMDAIDRDTHEERHYSTWRCRVFGCKYYHYGGWATEKEMALHHSDGHSVAASEPPTMFQCRYETCQYKSATELGFQEHHKSVHGFRGPVMLGGCSPIRLGTSPPVRKLARDLESDITRRIHRLSLIRLDEDSLEGPGLSSSAHSTPPSPATVGLPSPPSNFALSDLENSSQNLESIPILNLASHRPYDSLDTVDYNCGILRLSAPIKPSPSEPILTDAKKVPFPSRIMRDLKFTEARSQIINTGRIQSLPILDEPTGNTPCSEKDVSPLTHSTSLSPSDTDCTDEDSGSNICSDSNDESEASSSWLPERHCISPVLDSAVKLIVDRLLTEVHSLVKQTPIYKSCADSGTSSSGSSAPQPPNPDPGHDQGNGPKRTRGEGSKENPGGSGDPPDGPDQPNKKAKLSVAEVDRSRRLACPYYKRDPLMAANHRSCAGPGWDTVHRVKYVRFQFWDGKKSFASTYLGCPSQGIIFFEPSLTSHLCPGNTFIDVTRCLSGASGAVLSSGQT